LPRKGSRKSGQLFEKMVSMDNLYFLGIDTLSLYGKACRIQSFVHIQREYCNLYTDTYKREQYYSTELIEFYIFGIRVTQEMLNLAYKINESDALDKQKHISIFNTEDIVTLADSIALSIRKNMSWFDSAHVGKIKQNMSLVIDSVASDKIRNEYRDIL
jgi:hypothetical protein